MDTTRDILQARWHELKDQVRKRWNKLTDEDLVRLGGKTEDLAMLLRTRYGYGEAQAEIEIDNWLDELDRHAIRP